MRISMSHKDNLHVVQLRLVLSLCQDDNQADEDKEATDRERRLLQRDLIEASTRLDLAHDEIRRLTDELESARLTTRTYGKSFTDVLKDLNVFVYHRTAVHSPKKKKIRHYLVIKGKVILVV